MKYLWLTLLLIGCGPAQAPVEEPKCERVESSLIYQKLEYKLTSQLEAQERRIRDLLEKYEPGVRECVEQRSKEMDDELEKCVPNNDCDKEIYTTSPYDWVGPCYGVI